MALSGLDGDLLLDVRGLRTAFKVETGTIHPVADVSFSLRRGETLAVVGESGSGKSVTSLAIMRLLPSPIARIEAGSVRLRRKSGVVEDLALLDERQMRRVRGNDVAMIFQEPMTSLNPVQPVGAQVAEAVTLHELIGQRAAFARARDLLARVEIPDPDRRMRDYPHQLSGGMRQRVVIAMALACNPSLLIADEPTTALDVTVQAQVLRLMRRLQDDLGMGILFISHNLGVVAEVARAVAVMYAGRIVERGSVTEIFHRSRHPYTRGLLASLPRLGGAEAGSRARLAAIPGTVPSPARSLARVFVRATLRFCPPGLRGRPAGPRAVRRRPRHTLRALARNQRMTPILDVRSLRKHFPSRGGRLVRAVEDVSFTIAPGEVLGLVGESGSGKTTIGRMVLRLIEPTAGRILFEGRDLLALRPAAMRAVRRHIQIIFQDPFASLNPTMSIGAILAEGLEIHGIVRRNERAERVIALLERVGLPADAVSRYPHEFSGGQRQRIGIARALSVEPHLIVADEAVSALDVSVQAQVINLLQDLQAQLNLSMLFIAHDLAVVEHVADRVMVMYLGRIMEVASSRNLYSQPRHPYTAALLSAAPLPDPLVRRERIILAGDIPSPMAPPSGCVFRTRCPHALPRCAEQVPALVEASRGHWRACIRDDVP